MLNYDISPSEDYTSVTSEDYTKVIVINLQMLSFIILRFILIPNNWIELTKYGLGKNERHSRIPIYCLLPIIIKVNIIFRNSFLSDK